MRNCCRDSDCKEMSQQCLQPFRKIEFNRVPGFPEKMIGCIDKIMNHMNQDLVQLLESGVSFTTKCYDRDKTQCMLVDEYASQRFSSQNNSQRFAEPTILQMRLHARCKLLVSDNSLSTHVRPRQRSDVPSKYSLIKRPRLSTISGSSFCACKHLRKHSTTGCILVKTR